MKSIKLSWYYIGAVTFRNINKSIISGYNSLIKYLLTARIMSRIIMKTFETCLFINKPYWNNLIIINKTIAMLSDFLPQFKGALLGYMQYIFLHFVYSLFNLLLRCQYYILFVFFNVLFCNFNKKLFLYWYSLYSCIKVLFCCYYTVIPVDVHTNQ